MDLVFVVDMKEPDPKQESGRLVYIQNFIKSTVAGLGISEFGNHVGLVGYGFDDAKKDGWDLEK